MARPKGSKNKAEEVQGTTDAKIVDAVPTEKTTVKEVKVIPVKKEQTPLKDGDLFLLIVDGVPSYWTRTQGIMMFQRNSHEIEIPKGSPFTPPANSKCKGCG